MNPTMTGKKSPNRLTNPNNSRIMPITGHLIKTRKIPVKKQIVPRIFSLRLKNDIVRWNPITKQSPEINRI
jgi:hypothetical protein